MKMKNLSNSLNSEFRKIINKATEKKELTIQEGERLLKSTGEELNILIKTADRIRKKQVGDIVTYVVNRNINFTNICENSCKFCAFHRKKNSSDAYILNENEVAERTREAVENGATEICFQGGLNPALDFKDYLNYLEVIRSVSNDVHIHAYSPAEIDYMRKKSDLNLEEVILKLKDAGLNSIPGTAAEILAKRVRKIICPKKISVNVWEKIIKTCHRSGIPSSATIMYGHVETDREIASHLAKLREIQKITNGFTELVPLAFARQNTELQNSESLRNLEAMDHLKIHAVARLMLADYIDNIQTSWVKLGPELAKRTLNAGANDFSGTLMEENITRAAGGDFQRLKPKIIRDLINQADRIPRERTTTYELVANH
ncbi:hypothetical protein AKJ49_00960 [candidate division MSBL1 archaeon SCGC-AAA382A03]|uniref:5-amino-6-(D-ribitylamino)uracil--L-tyrosine 4-hydroxyphenyl transferase n=1 Tax=candidate division MSBL1 archaeon SCGC-AAA382A03 TaxID=1698278 RepID=A0A133VFZ9_9EURY|nr:hypothetical protein AKJ49_00960 [candidate division MSBL1 archaeon SCGC-AAA382A03]